MSNTSCMLIVLSMAISFASINISNANGASGSRPRYWKAFEMTRIMRGRAASSAARFASAPAGRIERDWAHNLSLSVWEDYKIVSAAQDLFLDFVSIRDSFAQLSHEENLSDELLALNSFLEPYFSSVITPTAKHRSAVYWIQLTSDKIEPMEERLERLKESSDVSNPEQKKKAIDLMERIIAVFRALYQRQLDYEKTTVEVKKANFEKYMGFVRYWDLLYRDFEDLYRIRHIMSDPLFPICNVYHCPVVLSPDEIRSALSDKINGMEVDFENRLQDLDLSDPDQFFSLTLSEQITAVLIRLYDWHQDFEMTSPTEVKNRNWDKCFKLLDILQMLENHDAGISESSSDSQGDSDS